MTVYQISASFFGRGGLLGPWPGYPVHATPGVIGTAGVVIDGSRAYGQVNGISSDPAFFIGPEPPGDPAQMALNVAYYNYLTKPGPH